MSAPAHARVAVQAELAHDRVLERPRQEVGQEVRARLLGERRAHLGAGEDVVAVVALEPLEPEVVDGPLAAAVGVGEHDPVVVVAQPGDQLPRSRRDPLGSVVQ